ncbi:peptidoglycan D,D-transpeptidase FtsI family protein [Paenibacillus oceani]|uniref:Penicillin-binding protein 2 n=1 Tax=Paenibacillus oceani TaxID=2772510 RepID=A0A927H399_9BACL|nr:penicillin-binding protein 2 [Paenibacillus oceani]MBD2865264.1 penicillin-binding protein 2 [Paenibacillus oceani]
MHNMRQQRRIWFGLLAITVVMAALIGRLGWIQVIDAGSFSRREIDLIGNSVAQREYGIELDSGRGHFVDRSGRPLTGEQVKALVVFPVKRTEEENEAALNGIPSILGADREVWREFYSRPAVPKMWSDPVTGQPVPLSDGQINRIAKLPVPGLEVMHTVRRYPADAVAKHLIGFIGENPERIGALYAKQLSRGSLSLSSRIGAAGLEKTMETYLQGAGKTSVSLFTDGLNRPLAGLDVRLIRPNNPYYPLQIGTTIDRDVQEGVERILEKAGIASGSAVVLDADNADVIAMASRPDFDPYRIVSGDASWGNKALKAVTPGSVFKTVVAAAALEEGVVQPGETFECSGSFGKYGLKCWLHGGHGTLTFEEAYAQSCNVVFAKVMQRLSGAKLQETAQRLGLELQVGWHTEGKGASGWSQFDGEERGQIFDGRKPSEDEGIRVQTAIGQRDVLVSPLQAANLVVTLLHGGEVQSPRVVRDIRFRTGAIVQSFPERNAEVLADGISKRTADKVTSWMRQVVLSGTGTPLKQAKWNVAGKSGTAQTTAAGQAAVHQWFVGYGPIERPKYAVAVVALNEPENGANRAIRAFREIMDLLERQ